MWEMIYKKSFWTWWIRQFLEKTKENVTRHGDIKKKQKKTDTYE